MKWIGKAFLQKILSFLPGGEKLNYFCQKNVTKRLPISRESFLCALNNVFRHYSLVDTHISDNKFQDMKLFEFGAGWHLVGPLTYAAMGVQNQTIVDLMSHLRFELLKVTLAYLESNRRMIEQEYGVNLSQEYFSKIKESAIDISLLQSIGINYQAPVDVRKTLFPDELYDLVVNTNTLEHIPPDDIYKIMLECHRILKPEGMLSCIVDLGDHFSYFDSDINIYNFLKYSDNVWQLLFNSKFKYQNRLRASNYLELFEKAGFKIITVKKYKPDQETFNELLKMKINRRFLDLDMEDVSIYRLDVLLKKK